MRSKKCGKKSKSFKIKSWILDYKMYSLKWHKNCDDKELKLDSPNPKFTFQYDDKNRGLAGQQLYNEKSAVCFDTHFNGESCYRYLLCLTSWVSSLLSKKIEYFMALKDPHILRISIRFSWKLWRCESVWEIWTGKVFGCWHWQMYREAQTGGDHGWIFFRKSWSY